MAHPCRQQLRRQHRSRPIDPPARSPSSPTTTATSSTAAVLAVTERPDATEREVELAERLIATLRQAEEGAGGSLRVPKEVNGDLADMKRLLDLNRNRAST